MSNPEVLVEDLKIFREVFQKKNSQIEDLLKFREVGTLLQEGNFQKILNIIQENKESIEFLDNVIERLEDID
ncbi:MAG TPA: hypothetical protein VIH61_06665 [Waddliaceae bacterium]